MSYIKVVLPDVMDGKLLGLRWMVCDYSEVITAVTCQKRRCHYLLTEGTWEEEVRNRKLSGYFLRGGIIIHLNCKICSRRRMCRKGRSRAPGCPRPRGSDGGDCGAAASRPGAQSLPARTTPSPALLVPLRAQGGAPGSWSWSPQLQVGAQRAERGWGRREARQRVRAPHQASALESPVLSSSSVGTCFSFRIRDKVNSQSKEKVK